MFQGRTGFEVVHRNHAATHITGELEVTAKRQRSFAGVDLKVRQQFLNHLVILRATDDDVLLPIGRNGDVIHVLPSDELGNGSAELTLLKRCLEGYCDAWLEHDHVVARIHPDRWFRRPLGDW